LGSARYKGLIGERSAFTGGRSARGLSVASWVRLVLIGVFLGLGLGVAPSAVAAAAPAAGAVERVSVCASAGAQARGGCPVVPIWQADTQGRTAWLNAPVRIGPGSEAPMGLFIKAFAASAVYWDGRLIGRNGRPASRAALEAPGLRDAVIAIPPDLSRPGVHRLQLQMSTMRAPLRLATSVVSVRVAPFEAPLQPALRTYLPALLTAGGLAIAILCLALLGWRQGRIGALKFLIGAGLFTTAQLAAETSRAFVPLLYPAQIVRLELVLLCAAGFALTLPAYLCRRFAVRRGKLVLAAQAGLIAAAVLAPPGLDEKVAWVILSSAATCLALCGLAVRRKQAGALALCLVLATGLVLGLDLHASFLDRDFYVWALLLFGLLLVQEAQGLREAGEAAAAGSSGPEALWLGSGPTRRLAAPAQIVRLAAADDYTEVFMAGAPAVLHPEPLHKLLARLPPGFVRVHRSHAVNLAHLESLRRGPQSSVTLSDRSVAPVSRRRLPQLIAAISA